MVNNKSFLRRVAFIIIGVALFSQYVVASDSGQSVKKSVLPVMRSTLLRVTFSRLAYLYKVRSIDELRAASYEDLQEQSSTVKVIREAWKRYSLPKEQELFGPLDKGDESALSMNVLEKQHLMASYTMKALLAAAPEDDWEDISFTGIKNLVRQVYNRTICTLAHDIVCKEENEEAVMTAEERIPFLTRHALAMIMELYNKKGIMKISDFGPISLETGECISDLSTFGLEEDKEELLRNHLKHVLSVR